MRRRPIFHGWIQQNMDERVRELPVKLKKSTRSVLIDDLTVERVRELIPRLEGIEVIQLGRGSTPEAVALLAQLPNLRGIDLQEGHFRENPGQLEALLTAAVALPNLLSLFCVGLPSRFFSILATAKQLRWLALRSPGELTTESVAFLGGLTQLEELQLLGRAGRDTPQLEAEAFEKLCQTGHLRMIHLIDVNLSPAALGVLLHARGLVDAIVQFRAPAQQSMDIRVHGQPTLAHLELPNPANHGEFVDLPALVKMDVFGFERLHIEGAPKLKVLEAGGLTELRLRDVPCLQAVNVGVGPMRFDVVGAPRLARVQAKDSGMNDADQRALKEALPRATLILTRPTLAKRRRTAPKRSLKPKEWKNPRIGAQTAPHAALIVGRRYDDSLALSKGKEIATIAEAWSIELGEHLAAILPFDLTPTGGLSSSDAPSPIVVGRVAALTDADAGPSAPVAVESLKQRLGKPLPEAFWAEVAGVIGNDAVEQACDEVHLVASGPLASGMLAHGQLTKTKDIKKEKLIVGMDSSQVEHIEGVLGMLVEQTDEAVSIDLDDLPSGPGSLFLIASYD